MRLIDADELIKDLMEEIPLAENVPIFKDIIESQPTAYNIDKAVEELNDLVIPIDKKQTRISLGKAIEIVKQGVR